MSAPSHRNITQTPQREFAVQRYYIFLNYANYFIFWHKKSEA